MNFAPLKYRSYDTFKTNNTEDIIIILMATGLTNGFSLDFLYKNYSKLIPHIGKAVVGDKEPYEYLTKSIEEFVNQEELIDLMRQNNFKNCSYRNLSGGIVAIHSGWKI